MQYDVVSEAQQQHYVCLLLRLSVLCFLLQAASKEGYHITPQPDRKGSFIAQKLAHITVKVGFLAVLTHNILPTQLNCFIFIYCCVKIACGANKWRFISAICLKTTQYFPENVFKGH